MNEKAKRKLIRKKEKELAKRKQEASSKRAWGAILLIVSAFSLVMIEKLIKISGSITGILFFTILGLVCFLYSLANLSVFKFLKKLFAFLSRLFGIRKIRVEVEQVEEPKKKEDSWSEF
ncbi:hypothetical protein [Enterococcus sp. BWR-S5]|uniref:hypothetical protein n=1 Tax=Enterococcus sp. BWR-S5 TaxID=2787714 RepID=UPI001920CE27|nr:hypothetical protein [Enterococcus sp. BWR-S5]MBL1225464.1 hypothetical protein [Enterococcus sp. BWR-S5]